MAVSSTQVSVTGSATVLVAAAVALAAGHTFSETASAGLRYVAITNGSGATIYVGGSAVTTSGATGGVPVAANAAFPQVLPLAPTEALYAITSGTTSVVGVLVTGT